MSRTNNANSKVTSRLKTHLESTCFVEGEHLAEWNRMILREHLHLPGGPALARRVLPDQLNGVRLDVRHGELPHLEHGREDGALKCAPARHRLVSVERGARLLPEHTLDDRLDSGDTSTSANYFNTENKNI